MRAPLRGRKIFRAFFRVHSGAPLAEQIAEMSEVARELEEAGDEENLARALVTRGWCTYWLGDMQSGLADARRAIDLATATHSPGLEAEAAGLLASLMRWGPTSWAELARFVDDRLASGGLVSGGRLGSSLLDHRALADAAVGDFDEARAQFATHQHSLEERGMQFFVHTLAFSTAEVELLAQDFDEAERILRSAWSWLGTAGESGYRSSIGVMLAEALLGQGRLDEASGILDECEAMAAPDDASAASGIATVRGLVASRRGLHDEAVALTQAGAETIIATDYVEFGIKAQIALATTLIAAARPEEARPVLRAAIALAERKGSLVLRDAAAQLLLCCGSGAPRPRRRCEGGRARARRGARRTRRIASASGPRGSSGPDAGPARGSSPVPCGADLGLFAGWRSRARSIREHVAGRSRRADDARRPDG